jgi:hypothetical protein
VFEEVTIKDTGKTVNGPRGKVQGAIVGSELHDDGTREDKCFVPGYGEFRSASPSEFEAMVVAVPTDAHRPGARPTGRILAGATGAFGAAVTHRWRAASAAVDGISKARRTDRPGGTPPRLVAAADAGARHARPRRHRPAELQSSQRRP